MSKEDNKAFRERIDRERAKIGNTAFNKQDGRGNADDPDARIARKDRKTKKRLVIETGELPKVAETLRPARAC